MAKTVVGLFDTVDEAQGVVQDLTNSGFNRNDISLVANDANGKSGNVKPTGKTSADTGDGEEAAEAAGSGAVSGTMVGGGLGLLAGLGALLIPGIGPVVAAGPIATVLGMTAAGAGIGAAAGGLIGALTKAGVPDDDANYYAEGVKRGGTLVMVKAEEDQADSAYDIMQRHGAVDIDERGADYRKEGFTKFDETSQPYDAQQVDTYRTNYASQPRQTAQAMDTTTQTRTNDQGQMAIPVMEEELQVGKRQVQRGGVRVYSQMTEQPVEEQVTLHEEKVNVERRPVNRAVTNADMAAFKEGAIEVTETDEEAVVSKNARVVEEVVVDKTAQDRTETIRDSVRRNDVQVEQIPGNDQYRTTETNTTRRTNDTEPKSY